MVWFGVLFVTSRRINRLLGVVHMIVFKNKIYRQTFTTNTNTQNNMGSAPYNPSGGHGPSDRQDKQPPLQPTLQPQQQNNNNGKTTPTVDNSGSNVSEVV